MAPIEVAKKKKKAVKSTEVPKRDVQKALDAQKEIDDLFSTAKKKKAEAAAEKAEAEAKAAKAGNKKKLPKHRVVEDEEDDEEDEEDEYDDEEEEEEVEESSQPYGMIQSKFKLPKIINPEAPLERIDAESGLPVYKAHLLKVGEGGGTPLCPFDCNCCF